MSKNKAGSEKFKVFTFLTINYLGFAIITTLSSFLPAVAYGKRRQRPWDYSWGFLFPLPLTFFQIWDAGRLFCLLLTFLPILLSFPQKYALQFPCLGGRHGKEILKPHFLNERWGFGFYGLTIKQGRVRGGCGGSRLLTFSPILLSSQ